MIQEVKQICLALCLDEMSILYTFYRYFRTALIYISLFPKMNEIKLRNKDNLFIPSNTVSSCFILFNKKINLKYIHICPTYFHNQNITDCSDQK